MIDPHSYKAGAGSNLEAVVELDFDMVDQSPSDNVSGNIEEKKSTSPASSFASLLSRPPWLESAVEQRTQTGSFLLLQLPKVETKESNVVREAHFTNYKEVRPLRACLYLK